MDSLLSGDSSHRGTLTVSQKKPEEGVGGWYFSRKEIEENSPSRQDGISLENETFLRWSHSNYLKDLGKMLTVPQLTIATAILYFQRFFLRQSHKKNNAGIIAIACMFLAGKAEETCCPVTKFILSAYKLRHRSDAVPLSRGHMVSSKESEFILLHWEECKKLEKIIFLAERVVLTTLGFDLNVQHPYKPLVQAIKKYEVAQTVYQGAWNFVNDQFRTSLCLQFKPHQIAASAILFAAANISGVEVPSEFKKVWWKEFHVTQQQLAEITKQMLELYKQERAPKSKASEAEGSGVGSESGPPLVELANEEQIRDTIQVKDGEILSSKDGTVAQWTRDAAYRKLDVERLRAAFKRTKALRGGRPLKVDPTDEIERLLEDIALPGQSEKTEHETKQKSYSCEDDLEEGEVGPSDMECFSPTSRTDKSKPGGSLDVPGEGNQRSDSAEDGNGV